MTLKFIFSNKLVLKVTFYLLLVLTINYLKQKTQKMKKVLFVVALGAFAACNSGANKDAKTDSATVKVDSAKAKVDTAAKAVVDTTKKK